MEMPAGLETMAQLSYALDSSVRPPKPADIADAFHSFFKQRTGPFEDFHIVVAHKAFNYLLENPREDGRPWLSMLLLEKDVFDKMLSHSRRPEKMDQAHRDFGEAILKELAKTSSQDASVGENGENEENGENGETEDLNKSSDMNIQLKTIRLLTLCNAAVEARNIAASSFGLVPNASAKDVAASRTAWTWVLEGVARQGTLEDMVQTTDVLQDLSIPLTVTMQKRLVAFFAEHKAIERAKYWYSQPVIAQSGKAAPPDGNTSAALLKACALGGEFAFGQEVVATMLKVRMPEKEAWDAIFIWSAAIGKGPDEVDRMMNVLVRRNDQAREKDKSIELIRPDVETINALVDLSMSKEDPYSAERYIAIGEKRGIQPDERTYTMQMQYRTSVGDLDGARAAYFNLQGSFSGAEQSVSAINQLIQVLCVSNHHHFDDLMAMVDELHERKANFAPETVAAVVLLHLRRGEIHDAMDLLSTLR